MNGNLNLDKLCWTACTAIKGQVASIHKKLNYSLKFLECEYQERFIGLFLDFLTW